MKNKTHTKNTHLTKENLQGFASMAQSDASVLSMTRIALNLPSFLELYADSDEKEHAFLSEAVDQLLQVLHMIAEDETGLSEVCETLKAAREKNVSLMKSFSAYADRFTIYEYILNRLEYRFLGGVLAADYSDAAMTQEILKRLSEETDQSLRQSLVASVIEQLPMRMTKTKFYQVIQEGLDAYKGSDRNAVDGILELLRTAAMLTNSCEMVFPEFESVTQQFSGVTYASLTKPQWEQLSSVLKDAMELLNFQMELSISYQELINDVLVVSMTAGACSHKAILNSKRAIAHVLVHGSGQEETMMQLYEPLEGVQEQYSVSFEEKAVLISEYWNEKELLEAYALTNTYQSLEMLTRLISSSRFAELSEVSGAELVDPDYVEKQAQLLIQELDQAFSQSPKLQNRAVMAKLVTMLPLFVRDYTQLEEYIYHSLSSCSDTAEKLACIEIIRSL